jgi:hypothetical protein
MSQKSSVLQAASFVSVVLKRDNQERNQDELLPASTGEYVERVLASLDKPSALIVGRAKSEEGDDLMTRAPPRAGMGETSGG